MSNESSIIFKNKSKEFINSMNRKSWMQDISNTGIMIYDYDYNNFKFDHHIIELLTERKFLSKTDCLDQIHKELSCKDMEVDVNQINNIVKTCYEPSEKINKIYSDFMYKIVQPVVGESVYFQKTPTFRFSFPKSKGMTKRDYHNDIMLGHPPEEINVWVPFTNSSESRSFVIIDIEKSLELLKKYDNDMESLHAAIWKDDEVKSFCDNNCSVVNLKKGQFILFDSRCIHAAILNESDYTRVSMDVRVISENEYNNLPFNYVGTGRRQSKFVPGDYYSSRLLT